MRISGVGAAALEGGRSRLRSRLARPSSVGDAVLLGLCGLACLLTLATIVEIGYQVFSGSHLAFSRFGLGFITHTRWAPNFDALGAGSFLFGTAVSSLMALLLAAPIGISIGLFLSMLAPRAVRGVIGPLVELLAAIP